MKYRFGALILALVLLLGFGVAEDGIVAAPDFEVMDTEGNVVTLYGLLEEGKPVIINIWASWCPPCRNELPYFEEAYSEVGDRVSFMMVNLADGSSETIETANSFVEKYGYTFPLYYDTEYTTYQSGYLGQYIPMTYLIGADGTILVQHVGGMTRETLYSYIGLVVEE